MLNSFLNQSIIDEVNEKFQGSRFDPYEKICRKFELKIPILANKYIHFDEWDFLNLLLHCIGFKIG